MKLDLNSLFKISPEIAAEDQAEWANYGRRIYQILHSEEFEKEVGAAIIWDSYPPAMAERLRGFLTKAVASQERQA